MSEEFYRMKRLPPYVIAEVNAMRAAARGRGEDIIDLGMGNPDLPPPPHVIDKLVEVARMAGLGPLALVRRVLLPAALPSVWTGLRNGLGLAWMFMVAAELIAASRGVASATRTGASVASAAARPAGGAPDCQKTSIGMPPRGYQ